MSGCRRTPRRARHHCPHPARGAAPTGRLEAYGDVRVDDWHWLRDRDDPAVIAYLEAENGYTEAMTAASAGLRERLYEQIKGRVQEDDLSAPARHGGWWYWSRTAEGSQYRIHCRLADPQRTLDASTALAAAAAGAGDVILDENALAQRSRVPAARRVLAQPRPATARLRGRPRRLRAIRAAVPGPRIRERPARRRRRRQLHRGVGGRRRDRVLHPPGRGDAAPRSVAPPPRSPRRRGRARVPRARRAVLRVGRADALPALRADRDRVQADLRGPLHPRVGPDRRAGRDRARGARASSTRPTTRSCPKAMPGWCAATDRPPTAAPAPTSPSARPGRRRPPAHAGRTP